MSGTTVSFETDADVILVVEKSGIFNLLVEKKFMQLMRQRFNRSVVMITGLGCW
jgi:DNA topoisomerase VI subunit A